MLKGQRYYPILLFLVVLGLLQIRPVIVFAEESKSKGRESISTSVTDLEAEPGSKGNKSILPSVRGLETEPAQKEKRAVLPSVVVVGKKPGPGAGVAILPFENLSGRFLLIDDIVKPFYQSLDKIYSLASYEDVDEAILQLRLRHTGYLTSEEALELGERLEVEAVILGMICAYQEAPDPKIGMIVKMIGTEDDTPILWMKSAMTSGNQRESWFGKDRILKTEYLVEEVIKDLIKDIPIDPVREGD